MEVWGSGTHKVVSEGERGVIPFIAGVPIAQLGGGTEGDEEVDDGDEVEGTSALISANEVVDSAGRTMTEPTAIEDGEATGDESTTEVVLGDPADVETLRRGVSGRDIDAEREGLTSWFPTKRAETLEFQPLLPLQK